MEEIFFYSLASQSEIPADNTSVPTLKAKCLSLTPQPFVMKASEGAEQREMGSGPGSRTLIGRFVCAGQGDGSPLEREIRSSQGIGGVVEYHPGRHHPGMRHVMRSTSRIYEPVVLS